MKKIVIAIVALAIVGGGAWWILQRGEMAPPTAPTIETTHETAVPAPSIVAEATIDSAGAAMNAVAASQAAVIPDSATSVVFLGVVQRTDGTPVPNAVLRFGSHMEALPEVKALPTATTDEEGAYSLKVSGDLEVVSLMTATLLCEAPGLARGQKALMELAGGQTGGEVRVDFVLTPGSRVYGVVTNGATGAPVAGAVVRFSAVDENPFVRMRSWDDVAINATSGADGRYEVLGFTPGSYASHVAVTSDGLILPRGTSKPFSVLAGTDHEANIVLQPGAVVQGKISVVGGSLPATGVEVSAQISDFDRLALTGTDFSDGAELSLPGTVESTGAYKVLGLEFGAKYSVDAVLEGYASASSEKFAIAQGQSPLTVNLEISRGSAIRGMAKHEDGSPAVGVSLVLLQTQKGMSSFAFSGDKEDKTDARGEFMFEHVNAGNYRILEIESLNSVYNPFTKDEGLTQVEVDGVLDVSGLVLSLPGKQSRGPARAPITGRVVDAAGAPVADAVVNANDSTFGDWKHATTGADGTFRIEGLTEDAYRVHASSKDNMASKEGVAPGSDITLQLKPRPKIAGSVVDAAGDPVPGCKVRLSRRVKDGEGAVGQAEMMRAALDFLGQGAVTNEVGYFEITGFETGHYVVKATSTASGSGESAQFDIAEGESKLDVRVQLAAGVTFSGTVVDSEGQPIAGAKVTLAAAVPGNPMAIEMSRLMSEEMRSTDGMAITSASGEFMMANVAPGEYEVAASAREHASARSSIALSEGKDLTGYKVVLGNGGCISGIAVVRGVSKAGLLVQTLGDGGMKMAETDETGHFEICALTEGKYTVMVMDPASMSAGDMSSMMPVSRSADVKDGETTEVDFRPAQGSVTVQGVVRGKLGKMTTVSLRKAGAPGPADVQAFDLAAGMEMLENMGGMAMAGPDGAFVLENVAPGAYVLDVHSIEFDPAHPDMEVFAQRNGQPQIQREITVVAGQPMTLELDLPE